MTNKIDQAEKGFADIVARRRELEKEYTTTYEVLKQREDETAARVLAGAGLDEETQRINEQRQKREQIAAALELAERREGQAKQAIYQARLEDAWVTARKIWTRAFKSIDKLTIDVAKITAQKDGLIAAERELSRLAGQFSKTEGANIFGPEARIIGQAGYSLKMFSQRIELLDKSRAAYDKNWTDR
jgi:hypothetical protein